MNLVEKLLAADRGEIEKLATKEILSKQLSRILGEPTTIKIQAIDSELFTALSASGLDENGNVDYNKTFNTNAKIAAAGIVEPDLKNEALLKHLEVATPADAAKKIFKGEINKIIMTISDLSGFESEKNTDKKVKN